MSIEQYQSRGEVAAQHFAPAPASGPQGELDSWVAVVAETAKLAKYIADTDFVPDAMRGNPAAVTAAMLTGREMNIGPMTSLRHIHIVKGKPGQSAELMRSLVLAEGHHIRYVDTSDSRCVVEGRRRDEEQWERVTFTADQARKARIDLGGYPEDKLVARATTRLCRRKFADCISGMPYTTDELEDGDLNAAAPVTALPAGGTAAGNGRTAQRKTRQRVTTAQAAPAGGDTSLEQPPQQSQEPEPTGPPLPGEEGYDEPDAGDATQTQAGQDEAAAEPAVTKAQLTKLGAIFTEANISSRDTRIAAVSHLVGRVVASSSDLTRREASGLIDTLERMGEGGDLATVVAELLDRASEDADEPGQEAGGAADDTAGEDRS